jgi:hypothetical protein
MLAFERLDWAQTERAFEQTRPLITEETDEAGAPNRLNKKSSPG